VQEQVTRMRTVATRVVPWVGGQEAFGEAEDRGLLILGSEACVDWLRGRCPSLPPLVGVWTARSTWFEVYAGRSLWSPSSLGMKPRESIILGEAPKMRNRELVFRRQSFPPSVPGSLLLPTLYPLALLFFAFGFLPVPGRRNSGFQ